MIKKLINLIIKKKENNNQKEKKEKSISIYEEEPSEEKQPIVEISTQKVETEIDKALKLKDMARIIKEVDEEEIKRYKLQRIEKFLESQTNAIANKIAETMIQPLTTILERNEEVLKEVKETKAEVKEIKEILLKGQTKENTTDIQNPKNIQEPKTEIQPSEEIKKIQENNEPIEYIKYIEPIEHIKVEESNTIKEDKPIKNTELTESKEELNTYEKIEIDTNKNKTVNKSEKTSKKNTIKNTIKIESNISNILKREIEKITKIKEKTLKDTIKTILIKIKETKIDPNKDKIIIANALNLSKDDLEDVKEIKDIGNEFKEGLNKVVELIIEKLDQIEKTPSVKVNKHIDKSENKKEIIKLSYVNLLQHITSMIVVAEKIAETIEAKEDPYIRDFERKLIIVGSIIHDLGKIETENSNHKENLIVESIEENTIGSKILKQFLEELSRNHDKINQKDKRIIKIIKIADKITRLVELRLLQAQPKETIDKIIKETQTTLNIKDLENKIKTLEKSKNILADLIKITAQTYNIEKAINLAIKIHESEKPQEIIKTAKENLIEKLKREIKEKKNEKKNSITIDNDYYIDY